nr:hypothetical protein [uncultured Marinifilum sp.]
MKKFLLLTLSAVLFITYACDNESEEEDNTKIESINVSIETIKNDLKLIAEGYITIEEIDPYNENSKYDDWGEAFFK